MPFAIRIGATALAFGIAFTTLGNVGQNNGRHPYYVTVVTDSAGSERSPQGMVGSPTVSIVQRALQQTLIQEVGQFLDTLAEITSVFDIPIPLERQHKAELATLDS